MQTKKILFQKQPCYYTIEGEGEPLMLVHGFCGDGTIWNKLKANLLPKYQLIIPDLPGYGQSCIVSKDYVIEKFSTEHYADYLHQILVYENIPAAHIIGHSMGGYTALAFAEFFPHKLLSLVLFHSHCYEDEQAKKESRNKAIAFVKKYGNRIFVEELYANLFAPAFYAANKTLISEITKEVQKINSNAIIASCYAMINRKDRSNVLKNIKKPVLIIIGKLDTAINYDQTLNMCALPNVANVHILQQVGHMGMLEAPEETALIIKDFFNFQL